MPTGNGGRAEADVEADISTYAGWDSAYKVDGIFFDEVSGQPGDLGKYTDYVNFAKSNLDGGLVNIGTVSFSMIDSLRSLTI